MAGIDARGRGITSAPLEVATAVATSTEMKGKDPEAATTAFLGEGWGSI